MTTPSRALSGVLLVVSLSVLHGCARRPETAEVVRQVSAPEEPIGGVVAPIPTPIVRRIIVTYSSFGIAPPQPPPHTLELRLRGSLLFSSTVEPTPVTPGGRATVYLPPPGDSDVLTVTFDGEVSKIPLEKTTRQIEITLGRESYTFRQANALNGLI